MPVKSSCHHCSFSMTRSAWCRVLVPFSRWHIRQRWCGYYFHSGFVSSVHAVYCNWMFLAAWYKYELFIQPIISVVSTKMDSRGIHMIRIICNIGGRPATQHKQILLNVFILCCRKTNDAISCIASTVPSMCPNRLKYLNLLRDIASFFCSATEQNGTVKRFLLF